MLCCGNLFASTSENLWKLNWIVPWWLFASAERIFFRSNEKARKKTVQTSTVTPWEDVEHWNNILINLSNIHHRQLFGVCVFTLTRTSNESFDENASLIPLSALQKRKRHALPNYFSSVTSSRVVHLNQSCFFTFDEQHKKSVNNFFQRSFTLSACDNIVNFPSLFCLFPTSLTIFIPLRHKSFSTKRWDWLFYVCEIPLSRVQALDNKIGFSSSRCICWNRFVCVDDGVTVARQKHF